MIHGGVRFPPAALRFSLRPLKAPSDYDRDPSLSLSYLRKSWLHSLSRPIQTHFLLFVSDRAHMVCAVFGFRNKRGRWRAFFSIRALSG